MYRKQVSLIFLKWLLSCLLCRQVGREFSCSLLELTLALITSTKQELHFVFKGNYPSLHFWCVCKGLCTSILEVHQHKHLWSSWSGFSLTSCIHKWKEGSVTNLLPPNRELKHSVGTSPEMLNLKLLRRSHLSIFPWRKTINLRSPFNDISYIARYYYRDIFIANCEHSNMLKSVLFVELNNGEKRHWDLKRSSLWVELCQWINAIYPLLQFQSSPGEIIWLEFKNPGSSPGWISMSFSLNNIIDQ